MEICFQNKRENLSTCLNQNPAFFSDDDDDDVAAAVADDDGDNDDNSDTNAA